MKTKDNRKQLCSYFLIDIKVKNNRKVKQWMGQFKKEKKSWISKEVFEFVKSTSLN